MHTHILGIGGTFMAGLAVLASDLGHSVTGSDLKLYPPMSTQLEKKGIHVIEGYGAEQLDVKADHLIIGNVMCRGMPVIEAILNQGLPYVSGPEWLAKTVLVGKQVLAVSGTHGKTTTASMLAWILEKAGCDPGFLIGGIPNNFGFSARLGGGQYFVIEADEYDSAFFDKRSKFVHYKPNILIINNIEFDHADIFPNLEAIQRQFHHLVRTIPSHGCIIYPEQDLHIESVLSQGCFTPVYKIGKDIRALLCAASGNQFDVYLGSDKNPIGHIQWDLLGQHNIMNALAAISAGIQVGIAPEMAIQALNTFKGVKRRLELIGQVNHISVYDDFAHHPTAIKTTLQGLKAKVGPDRVIAIVDIRSNTMRAGHHQALLTSSVEDADIAYFFNSQETACSAGVFSDYGALLQSLIGTVRAGDHIVCMSNGGFGGFHQTLLESLEIPTLS